MRLPATRIVALLILLLGFGGIWFLKDAGPAARLLAASLGLIWVIKFAALFWEGGSPVSAVFFFWPGISVRGFQERHFSPDTRTGARFLEAWVCFLAGAFLLVVVSLVGRGESLLLNYGALLAVMLIVHLGLVEVLADGLRLLGFTPASLFDRPHLASSLRDFWSSRWNRAFVDMNKIFLLRPLRGVIPAPLLTFSIFAVSGLLHELGISYADGVSWGKPLAYFSLQGLGMEVERRRRLPRIVVWLWILLPLPLLFTPAFTNLFCGQLERLICAGGQELLARGAVPSALQVGGVLHLVVLCASVQVPGKLGWREDFGKLRPLNRKIFWTYGAYIFSIVVYMSISSFLLAREPASAASLLWAIFIALFWWARVFTDFLYMSHEDWPRGPLFEIGHICLTTVFVSLASLYSLVAFLIARAL